MLASFELDYLYFFNGLAFLLLAATVFCLRPKPDDRACWLWLALAAFATCVGQWLDMLSPGFGQAAAFGVIHVAATVASLAALAALVEFGRRGLLAEGLAPRGSRLAWLARPWLYLPLGVAAATGAILGRWEGMEATCRYALGLPGALFAGAVLWRASQRSASTERTGFRLAAAALLVYALPAGVVTPEASFFPASTLHEAAFYSVAGFPIDVARAACAWAAATGLWLVRCARLEPKFRPGRWQRWTAPAACAVVLAFGWTMTAWDYQVVDGQFTHSAASDNPAAGVTPQSTAASQAQSSQAQSSQAQSSQAQSSQALSKNVPLQRQSTGMSTIVLVLLVQGVIASLCLLAYRFSR